MLAIACSACGTRYRVPEAAAGKKARCKRCGASFAVAALADEEAPLQLEDLSRLATGQVHHREVTPLDGPADAIAVPMADYSPEIPAATGSAVGPIPRYLLAVAKSLLFPLRLANFITFACVCICAGLQDFFAFAIAVQASCFFIIALLIVYGWYMSFMFRTVHSASANEDRLPDLALDAGWIEDIFMPLLGALLRWLAACVPFIVGAVGMYAYGLISGASAAMQCGVFVISRNPLLAFDPTYGGGPAQGVLSLFALLLWPMFLLVVAIGGLPCLLRIDLIAIAIARSLPGYLLMSAIAVTAQIAPALLADAILPDWNPNLGTYPALGPQVAMSCVGVYFQIVAMWAIGLYYHYFKHRLAWNWG